jgi:putative flippase GtrA
MTANPGGPFAKRVRKLFGVEVVRYGLIGLVNTLFGYGVFVALQLTLGQVIHYTVVQVIANLIAIVEAYWLQRWLVFRHQGNWWAGLGRFASVYAGAFFFSLGMVALLVEVFGLGVLIAGAITLVLQAVLTYFANKWFTFRTHREVTP